MKMLLACTLLGITLSLSQPLSAEANPRRNSTIRFSTPDLLHNWICDMVLSLMFFLFSAIPNELRSSPKAKCKGL